MQPFLLFVACSVTALSLVAAPAVAPGVGLLGGALYVEANPDPSGAPAVVVDGKVQSNVAPVDESFVFACLPPVFCIVLVEGSTAGRDTNIVVLELCIPGANQPDPSSVRATFACGLISQDDLEGSEVVRVVLLGAEAEATPSGQWACAGVVTTEDVAPWACHTATAGPEGACMDGTYEHFHADGSHAPIGTSSSCADANAGLVESCWDLHPVSVPSACAGARLDAGGPVCLYALAGVGTPPSETTVACIAL